MKKYNVILFFTLAISAMFFTACENDTTRTVVYTEPIPYLTVMTQSTTTPADTYSEYMATYTPTETGTPNYFAIPVLEGVAADTAMGNSTVTAVTAAPVTDTAAAIPVTAAVPETETIPSSENISGTEESSETGMPSGSESTRVNPFSETPAAFPELPAADTASPNMVQADTAPPMHTETNAADVTDTNTSNGGTDNADQYTE